MKMTLKRSLGHGIGALRAYTLVAFGLASMALFFNLIDEPPFAPLLAWSLAFGLAAGLAGSLGAELRLLSGARYYRILPNGRFRLLLSVLVLLALVMLPVSAITLLQDFPIVLIGLAAVLTLAFLLAGLWLGINGPMYLGLVLFLPAMLSSHLTLEVAMRWEIVAACFFLITMLVAFSWRRFFSDSHQREKNSGFRAWVWHRPEQAIGWRMLCAHVGLTLVVLVIISLPYAEPAASLPQDPSPLAHLFIGIAFATTMMVALTALNEAVIYRQRMRRLLMLPGWDRRRLHAALEIGSIRLILTLGVLPTAVVIVAALITNQFVTIMLLLAALAITMQIVVGLGALAVAASRDGGIVFTAIIVAVVGSFGVLLMFNQVLEADAWPNWGLAWLGASVIGAIGLRYFAQKRWLNLSLESIDHWLVVRLAHQQWRADL